jgi:TRAP-type C4-dicarboxylate transport system permease small subunit
MISNAIVLYLLWLVLEGSWKMTILNMNSTGPATGMPLSYLYGIGIVSSIWMMALIIASLFKAIKGKSGRFTIIQSSEDVLSEVNPHQEDKIIAK